MALLKRFHKYVLFSNSKVFQIYFKLAGTSNYQSSNCQVFTVHASITYKPEKKEIKIMFADITHIRNSNQDSLKPGFEPITLFLCSTQLSMKFQLLINGKMVKNKILFLL